MSMVLQSRHLASTGYPHLASWPWTAEAAERVGGCPRRKGSGTWPTASCPPSGTLTRLAQCLAKPLTRYLEAAGARSALVIPVDPSLPSGPELFAASLSRVA